jgi:hypothetical protein
VDAGLSVRELRPLHSVIGVAYDANGNIIQEMNGTRVVYDAFNRVRKVTFLAECNYVYGPDNERVEINCTDTGGSFIVLYGPDGRRLGAYSPSADSNGRLYFSGAFQTVYFAGRPINVSTGKFLVDCPGDNVTDANGRAQRHIFQQGRQAKRRS